MLKVCIDTNIWISGIIFSGKPAAVVTAAFNRKFDVVVSSVILEEVERNLIRKFEFSRCNTEKLIRRILQVADVYEPTGIVRIVPNRHPDKLVLETAILGTGEIFGDRRQGASAAATDV